jgi:DNA polymerase III subunit epsilon
MLNQILELERPIGILDLETTGLNVEQDRIIQIALTMHYPDKPSVPWSTLVDPEVPILNTANHSITDEMVKGKPTFKIIAPKLAPIITNVDLGGYNVRDFDIKMLRAEMTRAGVDWKWEGHIIDPLPIYRMYRGHNLTNAYKEYVDPNGFSGAHDASVDVAATEAVIIGQLNRYPELPRTVKELSAFCFPKNENAIDETGKFVWCNSHAAFNFGKWRGKLLKDPDVRGYLSWMANTGDFSDEVKDICKDALKGIFPVKNKN